MWEARIIWVNNISFYASVEEILFPYDVITLDNKRAISLVEILTV